MTASASPCKGFHGRQAGLRCASPHARLRGAEREASMLFTLDLTTEMGPKGFIRPPMLSRCHVR